MKHTIHTLSIFIKEALFPSQCAGCQKLLINRLLCDACWQIIPIHNSFFCAACGQRAPDFKTCAACRKETPLASLGFATPYSYRATRKLIQWLKYEFIEDAAKPLGEIINAYLAKTKVFETIDPKKCILIPIPLHAKRFCWRGFNQAEKIAEAIATQFAIPLRNDILTRAKDNKPQVDMPNFESRRANTEGIFQTNKKFTLNPEVTRKTVILFDDVITSGATIQKASAVLKQAGFKKIYALAIAKG